MLSRGCRIALLLSAITACAPLGTRAMPCNALYVLPAEKPTWKPIKVFWMNQTKTRQPITIYRIVGDLPDKRRLVRVWALAYSMSASTDAFENELYLVANERGECLRIVSVRASYEGARHQDVEILTDSAEVPTRAFLKLQALRSILSVQLDSPSETWTTKPRQDGATWSDEVIRKSAAGIETHYYVRVANGDCNIVEAFSRSEGYGLFQRYHGLVWSGWYHASNNKGEYVYCMDIKGQVLDDASKPGPLPGQWQRPEISVRYENINVVLVVVTNERPSMRMYNFLADVNYARDRRY